MIDSDDQKKTKLVGFVNDGLESRKVDIGKASRRRDMYNEMESIKAVQKQLMEQNEKILKGQAVILERLTAEN